MVFSVTTIPNFMYTLTESFFSDEDYAWITYDCFKPGNGHKFGIYSDGRCNHYDVCGHICNHKTDKGWEEVTSDGSRKCNTCGWICEHETISAKDAYKHCCPLCGGAERDHTFDSENHICTLYSCGYECNHKDEAGKFLYKDGVCRCGKTCDHIGWGVTYSNLTEDTHTCDRCGLVVGHQYNKDNKLYKCVYCEKPCSHDDVIKRESIECRCGFTCDHKYKNNTEDNHICSECGKIQNHTFQYWDGKCENCDAYCNHTWGDGNQTPTNECTNCHYRCEEHVYIELLELDQNYRKRHKCKDCNTTDEHGFYWPEIPGTGGDCPQCGYQCAHEWKNIDGMSYTGLCADCHAYHYHDWWENEETGNRHCNTCQYECNHEGYWDSENEKCLVCNKICSHTWGNGIDNDQNYCTTCGYTCNHKLSGFKQNDAGDDYHICTKCNNLLLHDWSKKNGECPDCYKKCEHYNWRDNTQDGSRTCIACDYTCQHIGTAKKVSDYEHNCGTCGANKKPHDYNNGYCGTCQEYCNHSDGWTNGDCNSCDLICNHLSTEITYIAIDSDWGHKCGRCGFSGSDNNLKHEFEKAANGNYVCKQCGYICTHSDYEGDVRNSACRFCNMPCGHDWDNAYCTICDVTCDHIGFAKEDLDANNHKCTKCYSLVPHTWDSKTGKCSECGRGCLHNSWKNNPNGTRSCSTCYWTCEHIETATYLNKNQHYCSKCGGNKENHTFNDGRCDNYFCQWKCPHGDENGNWFNGDEYCDNCNMKCNHIGKGYELFDDYSHACGMCHFTIDHEFKKDEYGDYRCVDCNELCKHNEWNYGICAYCGKECDHDWVNSHCDICDKYCTHSFNADFEGNCNICDYVCTHYDITSGASNRCGVCGFECYHEYYAIHDLDYHYCTGCEILKEHKYSDGYCSICYYSCDHEWLDLVDDEIHKCKHCEMEYEHDYKGDIGYFVCSQCNYRCNHINSVNGYCVVCKYQTCSHPSFNKSTGMCMSCGYLCDCNGTINSYSGACDVCGKQCVHNDYTNYTNEGAQCDSCKQIIYEKERYSYFY